MNQILRTRTQLLTLVACITATATLNAAVITIDGTNAGFLDGVDRVIGWQFTVGTTPIAATQVGAFDYGQNGLANEHEVGIWLSDGTLVASAVVSAGTSAPLEGFFRYAAIAETTLQANTDYVIAATWPSNGDEFVWDADIPAAPGFHVTGFDVDSSVTLGNAGLFNDFTSAFAFPQNAIGDGRRAFWGPNLVATPVPEPSAVWTFFLPFWLALQYARPTKVRRTKNCSGAENAGLVRFALSSFLSAR